MAQGNALTDWVASGLAAQRSLRIDERDYTSPVITTNPLGRGTQVEYRQRHAVMHQFGGDIGKGFVHHRRQERDGDLLAREQVGQVA